jgi:hypothetical protein
MRTTPIPNPNIPMVLMTRSSKESPVFDPDGAIFTGISGIAEMFVSRDSYQVLFSDTVVAAGIIQGEAMRVPF